MLIATIIMFTSASMQLALDIFSLMVVIRGALIDQSIPDLDSRLAEVEKILSSFNHTVFAVIISILNVRSSRFVHKI